MGSSSWPMPFDPGTPANRDAALQRLRENGVEVATTEMVVFEWLGQAGTPEFKELSRLIR